MIKSVILIILMVYCLVPAQNLSPDIKKDFDGAVKLYNAKNYETALILFQRVMKSPQPNSRYTASAFFISGIYLRTKKYSELEDFTKTFLREYPDSRYADELKVNLIKSYLDREDYNQAFRYSLEFLNSSSSINFWNEIKLVADRVAMNYLSSSIVIEQSGIYKNPALKSFLLLLSGKLLLSEGNESGALEYFEEIISGHRSSDEYAEALNLKRYSSENSGASYPLVAVLMSLTDQNNRRIEAVNEILEGIKFAFHEYNSGREDKIGLLISDLERNEERIIDESNAVLENGAVRCVLGPVFSDDVRKVLNELDRTNICVVSPTATDDDLISMSENFYQANPSFEARGKTFAQYLYFVENRRKMAVLNSIDGYSPLLAASFSKEFEKLGGKVLIKETYKNGSQSLAEQMSRISAFSKDIEGIYAPISDRNDAMIILSQMVQQGLKSRIYGNQDWLIAKGFETSSELSNNLIFESDYFIDFNDDEFKDFSGAFRKTTGKDAGRNVLYGYDLARYIITVMRNIDPTRSNIKYKMESGINVTGHHNNISFDGDRVNKYINIVRYRDGIFELVDKFRSGK